MIKLKLSRNSASSKVATTASKSCKDLVPVDKSSLTVPIANMAAPWHNQDVDVWNSSCTASLANRWMDLEVLCVEPRTTFRELFTIFLNEGCWTFVFGGAVRDLIRGAEAPADIDAETSCELSTLLSICKKHYGNQCFLNNILHIGGSNSLETSVDISNWNRTMFRNRENLEYSTNSMAYDWSQHAIIDLSDRTAVFDTQNSFIRLPVAPSLWDAWASNGWDKTFRFWKLRVHGYSAADQATFDYIKNRFRNLAAADPQTLQKDYCKYALVGSYNQSTSTCRSASSNCSSLNQYDEFFRHDFGEDYWNSVLKPLFKDNIACILTYFKCAASSITDMQYNPAFASASSYNLRLMQLMIVIAFLVSMTFY